MGLTAVDLFSGGGGASIGIHRVDGVNLRAAAEINDKVREPYNDNLPIEAAGIDLTDDDALNQIYEEYDLQPSEIDLVIGCPPCQKYSSLQDTTPPLDNGPKNKLLNVYIDLIISISPKVVVFENVPGLMTEQNEQYVEDLKHYLQKAGYGFDMALLNTADYGVPQGRERAIAIGIKGVSGKEVSLPEPTHVPPEDAENDARPAYRTVEDAIGDLPPLEAGEKRDDLSFNGHRARNHRKKTIEFIKKIPKDGGSRTDLPIEEQLDCHQNLENKNSAGNVYGRMKWDEPGPTLTGRCTSPSSGRFVHPEQNRGISPREAARIMTFPDEYDLPEANGTAERLIGNAVPPDFITTILSKFLTEHSELIDQPQLQAAE
ncbi:MULTISPECIES: DNA cytosine methyltransferase [Halobacterium]|nr:MULTISPECIES: DNA cytosine methyltransferase [Halobacterium]MCF2207763.1 DNA cytosine methyltransferase [Halobacterium salinarum]MCF2237979.1 DNA cytosine methyltransferase [Halobacterium salinarum]MDL0134170.1 DNA cytosine methyltransferase [Halobacterium salinarum]MDL0139205.1 DNA cytosine methyltransferase [Halobacterium salinarum]QRY21612.1 DNA cytosine methyltransferase [Halobacterium sp. GSL-19]